MTRQREEFNAMDELASAYRNLPPVVDDSYPEARHRYDSALKAFLEKVKANGRL
jgi:hypothetical protein